jgi:hypothetical protein
MSRGPGNSGWLVAGASVQGTSHERSSTPCQDNHCWHEVANGILAVAVADGAGSSAFSDIGAFLAAQTSIATARRQLHTSVPDSEQDWQALLRTIVQAARHTLVEVADILGKPPVDLATTLLVALVTRERVAAIQIGDGAVIAEVAGELLAITRPPPQEYVNEATFLTAPTFLDRAELVVQSAAVHGLAVLTDGLQRVALQMPQGLPHKPFFSPLLRLLAATPDEGQANEQLKGFLRSPHIRQVADDDLTLILAVRNGEAAAGERSKVVPDKMP